jgi:hypothetical protein
LHTIRIPFFIPGKNPVAGRERKISGSPCSLASRTGVFENMISEGNNALYMEDLYPEKKG